MGKRLHYIDWLRIIAVLLLFPFHTLRVYNVGEAFYVKGPATSVAASYFLGLVDYWQMPLLFLLAGASSCLALRKRSARQYASERVRRLLVPFIFGFLVLIPPQTWYGARFNSGYTESFLRYLVSGDFLVFNIRDGGDYYGGFGVGHLWFILWLFGVSLVALPLLMWGRTDKGAARLGGFARMLAKPYWWWIPTLMIFVGEAMPDPVDKNFFYYLAFFVLGFVTMFDEDFTSAAERNWWWILPLGIASDLAWNLTWRFRDSLPDPSLPRAGLTFLGFLGIWLLIVGLIGVGKRYLDRPSKALSYLAEASYPIYILHQTVIVVFAYYIVKAPLHPVLQWLVLLLLSVVVTFEAYAFIRATRRFRVLFGMRAVKKPDAVGLDPS